MKSFSKTIIMGHLGSDPAVKYTNEGAAVCNFSVATNSTYKGKDGNKVEKVEWHRVVLFGKLAESCGQYLKKGSAVMVEGQNRTREHTDKDGVKRYFTEIVVPGNGSVNFLDSKPNGGESDKKGVESYSAPYPGAEDEVPF